ncbi:hypothetical protein Hanom_Chr09g00765601 [Helianthus anomalus]
MGRFTLTNNQENWYPKIHYDDSLSYGTLNTLLISLQALLLVRKIGDWSVFNVSVTMAGLGLLFLIGILFLFFFVFLIFLFILFWRRVVW